MTCILTPSALLKNKIVLDYFLKLSPHCPQADNSLNQTDKHNCNHRIDPFWVESSHFYNYIQDNSDNQNDPSSFRKKCDKVQHTVECLY